MVNIWPRSWDLSNVTHKSQYPKHCWLRYRRCSLGLRHHMHCTRASKRKSCLLPSTRYARCLIPQVDFLSVMHRTLQHAPWFSAHMFKCTSCGWTSIITAIVPRLYHTSFVCKLCMASCWLLQYTLTERLILINTYHLISDWHPSYESVHLCMKSSLIHCTILMQL